MSTEICAKCKHPCTPWGYVEKLHNHVCESCYIKFFKE